MQNVLILGAGMVARPLVQYLMNHQIKVTVAARRESQVKQIVRDHPNGKIAILSADDEHLLEEQISSAELVVSMLPYTYHLKVARLCLKHKKNMVTTSYVKPEMRALDKEAKEAGIIILNELGLDPGIDHMSAKRVIDHVHHKGGKIEEFYSFCGALPAPESADNPFKYKFSWSPRGVLMAGNNSAKYLKNGKIVDVDEKYLFRDLRWIDFPNLCRFEVYPNRDSLPYLTLYQIEEAKTIMRGTIRFMGWSEIIDSFKRLNLLSSEPVDISGKSYADFIAERLGNENSDSIESKLAAFLGIDINSNTMKAFEYAGFFSREKINPQTTTPFDIVADLMIPKMTVTEKDKDMIVMQHIFKAVYPDGNHEYICSRMIDFGDLAHDTAVARTVALPAAIGVRMILEGKITEKGVHIPVLPGIYNPILDELSTLGIRLEETYGLKEDGLIQK